MKCGVNVVEDFIKQTLPSRPLESLQNLLAEESQVDINCHFSFPADVWMYGMLCQELLSNDRPFGSIDTLDDLLDILEDGKRPTLPNDCGTITQEQAESIQQLIMEPCWNLNPSARPTMVNISQVWARLVMDISHFISEVEKDLKAGGFGAVCRAKYAGDRYRKDCLVAIKILKHGTENIDIRTTKVCSEVSSSRDNLNEDRSDSKTKRTSGWTSSIQIFSIFWESQR